jgi:hypothetical protein
MEGRGVGAAAFVERVDQETAERGRDASFGAFFWAFAIGKWPAPVPYNCPPACAQRLGDHLQVRMVLGVASETLFASRV